MSVNSNAAGTETLLNMWEGLGNGERKILLSIGWRLRAGQRKYGLIEEAQKEWDLEAIEEAMDASVYLGALMAQRMDAIKFRTEKEPDLNG